LTQLAIQGVLVGGSWGAEFYHWMVEQLPRAAIILKDISGKIEAQNLWWIVPCNDALEVPWFITETMGMLVRPSPTGFTPVRSISLHTP
jgi:hypothetical protein